MASGTFTLATVGDTTFTFRIYWTSTANIANNTSTVNVYIQGKVSDSFPESSWLYLASGGGYTSILANYPSGGRIHSYNAPESQVKLIKGYYNYIAGTSFTVSHASDGTRSVALVVNVDGVAEKGPRCGGTGKPTITLDRIPQSAQITTAPNFTDEQNPTIVYNNGAGENTTLLQACISLTGAVDDIAYRDISKTDTSYTFELTDAEREVLRKATLSGSNTRSVMFMLKSELNGVTSYSNVTKTLTIANCAPSVSATFYDVNEKTVQLTQNSDIFIKGYSTLESQLEGVPKKHASITSYKTTVGSSSATTKTARFEKVNADEITYTVTDNRGQTGTLTLPIDTFEYTPITCSITSADIALDEEHGTTAVVRAEISGKYFNSKFGADGVANKLTIQVKHTGTNGQWVTLTDGLIPILNGNNYKLTFNARGLDYKNVITLQARALDKLSEATSDEKSLRLIPVFDWSNEDFNFNVPITVKGDVTIEGNLVMNGEESGGPADYIIEQGTEAMGTNGTWYWEKWKNGKAVCYGVRNFGNMSVSSSWGSFYEAGPFHQPFPTNLFVDTPDVVNMSIRNTSAGAFLEYASSADLSATRTGNFYVARASSSTLSAVHICFNVIGRWK